jgi:hypothetical protein
VYINAPTLLPQNRPFEAVGLFGSTGDNTYKPADTTRTHAVIKNIILDDITMIGFQDVGGVVGIADANTTINNVSVSGTIGVSQTGYGDLGGIVGWTNGGDGKPIVIQNSKVDIQFQVITPDTATTNLPWCAGGIVGYADWTQVSDSQSDLTVDSQIINGTLRFQINLAIYFGFKSAILVGHDYISNHEFAGHWFEKGITRQDCDVSDWNRSFLEDVSKVIDLKFVTLNKNIQSKYELVIYPLDKQIYKENSRILESSSIEYLRYIKEYVMV